MPSKRRKPETLTASLSQDKVTKKAKTTQTTLPPRIREWGAVLPAEPKDQQSTFRAVQSESVSSGITSLSANPSAILNPSLHGDAPVVEELSPSGKDLFSSTESNLASDIKIISGVEKMVQIIP